MIGLEFLTVTPVGSATTEIPEETTAAVVASSGHTGLIAIVLIVILLILLALVFAVMVLLIRQQQLFNDIILMKKIMSMIFKKLEDIPLIEQIKNQKTQKNFSENSRSEKNTEKNVEECLKADIAADEINDTNRITEKNTASEYLPTVTPKAVSGVHVNPSVHYNSMVAITFGRGNLEEALHLYTDDTIHPNPLCFGGYNKKIYFYNNDFQYVYEFIDLDGRPVNEFDSIKVLSIQTPAVIEQSDIEIKLISKGVLIVEVR